MSSLTSRVSDSQSILRELRREFIFIRNGNLIFLVPLICVALVLASATHIVSNWNSAVASWNLLVSDLSESDVLSASSEVSPEMMIDCASNIVTEEFSYRLCRLVNARSATDALSSFVAGVSFLSFVAFPVLSVLLGIYIGSREYKARLLLLRPTTSSFWSIMFAKLLALLILLSAALFFIGMLLPLAVLGEQKLVGVDVSDVLYNEVFAFQVFPVTDVWSVLSVFLLVIFISLFFALCGTFLGEISRGESWVLVAVVVSYYFLPLGGILDPRNLLASIGKVIFWFPGSFNPYVAQTQLLGVYSSALLIFVIACAVWVFAATIRNYRMSHATVFRKISAL